MDSGNSGSLQSSSGGDGGGGDVNHLSTHFNPIPILQPRSNLFDPSSFSQPLNPNPNPSSMYNLDSLWSSNPNPNPIYNLNPNPVDDSINLDSGHEKLGVTTKNPKKRTRASRRAPTTVLTTDTSNFRQMVQEFTGIPTAPFSTSSSSPSPFSRRIDLYGGGMAPIHPLRPSAQKAHLQQPSYLNSASAPTSNFQLPPFETPGFTKQPLNLSNLQNQMFPFQAFSQSTVPQQINVTVTETERESQRSEHPDAFLGSSSTTTSVKRWRGQDENSQNVVVPLRNDGDQIPGNEDSWICPSD